MQMKDTVVSGEDKCFQTSIIIEEVSNIIH